MQFHTYNCYQLSVLSVVDSRTWTTHRGWAVVEKVVPRQRKEEKQSALEEQAHWGSAELEEVEANKTFLALVTQ